MPPSRTGSKPATISRHDALMQLQFPRIRHAYTARDTMLYALGVGAGSQARGCDLDLVYEDGLAALPTMAVTLAYPGFWYRDLAPDLDHLKTVHASERFELHAPLPVAATVEADPKVVAIYDKGPGRGTLIASERTIRDAGTGRALATVRQTAFCRGDGDLGGPRVAPPAPHHIPDRPADREIAMATSLRAALIYRLSGDDNPLHVDPGTARRAGFPAPILHGLSTYGHVGRAILGAYASSGETILSMDCRFVGFVLPGDRLGIELWRDGAEISFRTLAGGRKVIDNGVAVIGTLPA